MDTSNKSSEEELRKVLSKLFDDGMNLKARAGHTIESEFMYRRFSIDEAMALISTYTEQKVKEARIDELKAIQLNYGHYSAQTFINKESQGIVSRIKELESNTNA